MDMRLSQLHPLFLKDLAARGASPLTIEAYRSDFQILRDFTGDDVRALNVEVMTGYAAWLAARKVSRVRGATGHSPRGIARRMDSASSFCKWLVRRGDLKMNPLDALPRPKRPKRLPRAVPVEWVDAILALPDVPLRDRAIVGVMRYCGLRVSEACNLDLADVDLLTDRVIVRNGKGGQDRVIPLRPVVHSLLATWLNARGNDDGPLFSKDDGGRLQRKRVEVILHRLATRAGVGGIVPHQLRHTFATELARRGVNLPVLQTMMGHSDPATTSIYIQVTARDLKEAMERVEAGR